MKVFYNPFSTSSNGYWFENKLYFLVPFFILAVLLGFLLELVTVERLNLFIRVPLTYREVCDYPPLLTYRHHILEGPPKRIQLLIRHYVKPTQDTVPEESQIVFDPNAPLWEKPTLFNISRFMWIRNNKSICQVDQKHPKARILPILVHTARSHVAERLTIRKSWGSLLGYKKWSIRLVFLIGQADRGPDPSKNQDAFQMEEALLDSEQSMFGDIVQGNFIDSYKNLTYKHMMAYRWILNFCSNATFVMKVDDDIYVDLMRFLNWRNDDLQSINDKKIQVAGGEKATPLPDLYCSTFVGTKPQRCVGCKWYTSEEDWPLDYYPDYCSGWCYGITVDLIQKLYSTLDSSPFFWIDDVYATGVLLEEMKKANKGYEPVYKHLWGQVKSLDFKNFRPMCERHDISMTRKFGAVVPIPRGSNFERDMMCLWNKTVYDDEQEFKNHNNDVE